jgi:transcriptional regulator with XRE-family HTH domain
VVEPSDGDRLRRRRQLLGLTIQEVADELGKSRSMLCLMERGKRKMNPLAVERAIRKATSKRIARLRG